MHFGRLKKSSPSPQFLIYYSAFNSADCVCMLTRMAQIINVVNVDKHAQTY